MGRKVLTREAAFAAKRMYDEVDEWGRHVNSIMSIAAFLAVSETTIFRVVHNFGAYMDIPAPKPANILAAEAAASEQAFRNNPETRALIKTEDGKGLAKLQELAGKEAAKTAIPNALLDELSGIPEGDI